MFHINIKSKTFFFHVLGHGITWLELDLALKGLIAKASALNLAETLCS